MDSWNGDHEVARQHQQELLQEAENRRLARALRESRKASRKGRRSWKMFFSRARRVGRRVTALWVSKGKPRPGTSRTGNAHTGLGSASCGSRWDLPREEERSERSSENAETAFPNR
jgi:hypothetical protein